MVYHSDYHMLNISIWSLLSRRNPLKRSIPLSSCENPCKISSMIASTLHRFSSSHHLEVVTEENPGYIMKQNSRIKTCFVSHPPTTFLDNHYVNYRHMDHRHQNVVMQFTVFASKIVRTDLELDRSSLITITWQLHATWINLAWHLCRQRSQIVTSLFHYQYPRAKLAANTNVHN